MSTEPSADEKRRGLKPPQFGLGTMFLAVTLLCCLFVAFRLIGPVGGTLLVLLMLAVLAHVAGNVLGRRLRATDDEPPSDT